MSYQKDTEDKDDRSFRTQAKLKLRRNTGNRQERHLKSTRRQRRTVTSLRHTQKGWQRIRELVRDKQGAAAIGLYSFFAEHIDPTCGAVVCDQQFLANQMGVSTRTIRRWLDYLEEKRCFGKNTSCWKRFVLTL